ncbi:MAG: hypothetical protein OXC38_04550 [Gammaproteobacteria bacterium]|nr:hypothetical protein [Gammaproteobacteria bacterium]
MIHSDSLSIKPNEPILLEDTNITHIEDQQLPNPCPIQVVLHLSPKIRCRVDSTKLPIQLMQGDFLKKPFSITLQHHRQIKVRLGLYDPNSFFNGNPKDTFEGTLIPYRSPCTVVPPDAKIQSVRFGVLNFNEFYSKQDKFVTVDKTKIRLGSVTMQHDDWQIEATSVPNLGENLKILRRDGGYAITHTGTISRSNNEAFSVEKIENILRGMQAFLSFSRGAGCGLTPVEGIDESGNKMPIIWGTSHTEPWTGRRHSWLPQTDGGDSLSAAFSGFWSLYNDSAWNEAIRKTIDWYTVSRTSPVHVGIVLAQVALESLSHQINGRKIKPVAKALSEMLRKLSIDGKIPDYCESLKDFASQNNLNNAPQIIAEIRNDMVHSERKHISLPAEVQFNTLYLAQCYIEMVLLKKFEYCGRYLNRLKAVANEDPYEQIF